MLADCSSVQVNVSAQPYRQMTKVVICEWSHIRFSVHHKVFNPVFVSWKDIKWSSSGNLVVWSGSGLCLVFYIKLLNKNIVVDSVVTMKNCHKACNLSTVADVVRSITRFTLSVNYAVYAGIYEAERTVNQVMNDGNSFARDCDGNL